MLSLGDVYIQKTWTMQIMAIGTKEIIWYDYVHKTFVPGWVQTSNNMSKLGWRLSLASRVQKLKQC